MSDETTPINVKGLDDAVELSDAFGFRSGEEFLFENCGMALNFLTDEQWDNTFQTFINANM